MTLQETNTNGYLMDVERYEYLAECTTALVSHCHNLAYAAGWWNNRKERNIAEALCLIHSEISEALEGIRKNKQDEHLSHHQSITVELADAIIRICDLAGGLQLPLGAALAEKLCYNQVRMDHKLTERAKVGGKRF
jgi:NTP pyrophosphatase (non-canonical NTP hydrolase)